MQWSVLTRRSPEQPAKMSNAELNVGMVILNEFVTASADYEEELRAQLPFVRGDPSRGI